MLKRSVLLMTFQKGLSQRQGTRLLNRISTVKCPDPKSLLSRTLDASPHYIRHDLHRPAVHRAEIHRDRMSRAQTRLGIRSHPYSY